MKQDMIQLHLTEQPWSFVQYSFTGRGGGLMVDGALISLAKF